MIQEDKSITRKNLPDGFYQIVILGATVHDNCKSQYKNVGLGQYKNVGFPTLLYCLF